MTTTKEPDIHPFDKAGYGPAPYVRQHEVIDDSLGLCCDSCGKTGLKTKFFLMSSTDQLFGVGSECVKKSDPELWLEMKSYYGSDKNITTVQIKRRQMFDEAQQMIETIEQHFSKLKEDHMFSNAVWEFRSWDDIQDKRMDSLEPRFERLTRYCNDADQRVQYINRCEEQARKAREEMAERAEKFRLETQRLTEERKQREDEQRRRDAEIRPELVQNIGKKYKQILQSGQSLKGFGSLLYVAKDCAEYWHASKYLDRYSTHNLKIVDNALQLRLS